MLPADDAAVPAANVDAEMEASASQPVQLQSPVSSWGGETTLTRDFDGHFYADVLVNGQPIRMLVDTGASVVALTADDAAAAGLNWYEDDVRQVARGASGPVYGVHTAIEDVRLGDIEASGVEAVIIPEGAHISLLGQSFLSAIGTVEISGDQMVLGS